jgi:hypothetical protein
VRATTCTCTCICTVVSWARTHSWVKHNITCML